MNCVSDTNYQRLSLFRWLMNIQYLYHRLILVRLETDKKFDVLSHDV